MATRKTGKDTPPAEPEIREEIAETDQALPGTAADRGRPSRPNRGHEPPADEAVEEEGSISNRGDEYMKEDEQPPSSPYLVASDRSRTARNSVPGAHWGNRSALATR